MTWYKNGKIWAFIGGVAAAGAGAAISTSAKVRELTVKCVAKGIMLKENAQETVQSIKDDAEDVAADARAEAQQKAALAAKRAEIEERIRAQVEAEMSETE